MHAIQRRMQAEGLGADAVLADLGPEERENRMDELRSIWEPRIIHELLGSKPLGPMQSMYLVKTWRLRHGSSASMWLADNDICYVISRSGEAMTAFGIDNNMAQVMQEIESREGTPTETLQYRPARSLERTSGIIMRRQVALDWEEEEDRDFKYELDRILIRERLAVARRDLQSLQDELDSYSTLARCRADYGRCSFGTCDAPRATRSDFCGAHAVCGMRDKLKTLQAMALINRLIASLEGEQAELQAKLTTVPLLHSA